MATGLDLIEETLGHFAEGARSVRAYTNDNTYVITQDKNDGGYWVADELSGYQKKAAKRLEEFFDEVFGIEATY